MVTPAARASDGRAFQLALPVSEVARRYSRGGVAGGCARVEDRRRDLCVELGEIHARKVEALQLGHTEATAIGVTRGVAAPTLPDLRSPLLVDDPCQMRIEAAIRLRPLEAGDTPAEDIDAARAVIAELNTQARVALHRRDLLVVAAAHNPGVLDRQHRQ